MHCFPKRFAWGRQPFSSPLHRHLLCGSIAISLMFLYLQWFFSPLPPSREADMPSSPLPELWQHSPPCLHSDITLQPPSSPKITPGNETNRKGHRHRLLWSYSHTTLFKGHTQQCDAQAAVSQGVGSWQWDLQPHVARVLHVVTWSSTKHPTHRLHWADT